MTGVQTCALPISAGAVVDGFSTKTLEEKGISPEQAVEKYDSYNALGAIDARLETGPTDTNVTDLHLLAVEGRMYARDKK